MLPAGLDPRTPVLVGVGQIVHRPGEPGLPGPAELATEALRRAGADSGAGDALLRSADLLASVAPVSRPYPNLAALVAAELGASPKRTLQSAPFGSDGPQRLLNTLAQTIADGKSDIALITGAESVASWNAATRRGTALDWPEQDERVRPNEVVGADDAPNTEMETAAGLWGPIYMYALMETAMRGRLGLDVATHRQRIGELWSRFSAVAVQNPYAWLPTERDAAELLTPTPDNRMVSSPYPKLLVANLTVDQGAGLILCSAAAADAAGCHARNGCSRTAAPPPPIPGSSPSAPIWPPPPPSPRRAGRRRRAPVSGSTKWPISTCTPASRWRFRWAPWHWGCRSAIRPDRSP
ncbi:hypothetical protein [Nocardia brevicatena]|uniref:hypothetical protein n=1 Tax=Nocardia brevicatena TaxID=37327 RepID=UPI0002D6717D|nr:hypothetical protein [Nocardia brevicatena]